MELPVTSPKLCLGEVGARRLGEAPGGGVLPKSNGP